MIWLSRYCKLSYIIIIIIIIAAIVIIIIIVVVVWVISILSHSKYNAHSEPLFKKHKLLKICDILKLQELKFYYKYKNSKLSHYLQSLSFQTNSNTHNHATRIQHKIHQPMGNHVFAKNCIILIYPCLSVNAPNSIIDQIYTHNLQGFFGYMKAHILQSDQENRQYRELLYLYT